MPKDIVICCDGTGNEIGANISNVLKLFRVSDKDDRQRIYYHPGLGTIGLQNSWGRFKQEVRGLFGLAFGPADMLPSGFVERTALEARHLENPLVRLLVGSQDMAGRFVDRR